MKLFLLCCLPLSIFFYIFFLLYRGRLLISVVPSTINKLVYIHFLNILQMNQGNNRHCRRLKCIAADASFFQGGFDSQNERLVLYLISHIGYYFSLIFNSSLKTRPTCITNRKAVNCHTFRATSVIS